MRLIPLFFAALLLISLPALAIDYPAVTGQPDSQKVVDSKSVARPAAPVEHHDSMKHGKKHGKKAKHQGKKAKHMKKPAAEKAPE